MCEEVKDECVEEDDRSLFNWIRSWNVARFITSYNGLVIWNRYYFVAFRNLLAVQIKSFKVSLREYFVDLILNYERMIVMRIVVYKPGKFMRRFFGFLFGIKRRENN